MSFQDVVTFLIVGGAVAFLVHRVGFASRRRDKRRSKGNVIPVKALLRKRPKR